LSNYTGPVFHNPLGKNHEYKIGEWNNGIFKFLLENKLSLYFGKISYGIYIIHNYMPNMFYSFFARKLPPTDEYSIKVFYWISLTILMASISWFLIERPILKLKKYFV
jgi:peptidoglycan/LPS O-acetylase OafA/YrhL